MEKALRQDFITALEKVYGGYKQESALFGSSNFSKITSDLCYSNSHFSKLISGGATNAMYERALKNVGRLQNTSELEEAVQKSVPVEKPYFRYIVLSTLLLVALGTALFTYDWLQPDQGRELSQNTHPLDSYSNFSEKEYFKSPYLTEEQVHEYCPGSAFEGRWGLSENYIIPIPYKIPGLYYVGKSADIRLKCKRNGSEENRGKELIGFENIHNEIWFDTSLTPVDSKYYDKSTGQFSSDFLQLDFENIPNFLKIADVYSCFFDEILIAEDSIYRRGEPCGRYANPVNEDIYKEYNLDLKHIIEYIIGSMVFAECRPIKNDFCDPNELFNGTSIMSFPCSCSIKTENLGLGGAYPYRKSIKLEGQNYQSNLLCNCNSDF